MIDLNVVLLHDKMVDRRNTLVTTSLTLIDIHDIARSCMTYSAHAYVAHPAPAMRKLAHIMKDYWENGFGTEYNPHRGTALKNLEIATSLDEVIHKVDLRSGRLPKLIATSAHTGSKRITFNEMRAQLQTGEPYLLMLGTGWGMSDELLARADYFLEPVLGSSDYNHLSVRSACAIMLDRLVGR